MGRRRDGRTPHPRQDYRPGHCRRSREHWLRTGPRIYDHDTRDRHQVKAGVIETKGIKKKRSRGLARLYGHFRRDELKPYIARKYRTKPDPEFTGLGGSSLGGLVTLAIGLLYPETFHRLMVMSPSVWWGDFAV